MSTDALIDRLVAELDDIPDSHAVYVGYSGGLDSTVLLHAAVRAFPGRVTALHGNHGLHGDADSWQAHCESQCRRWQVPLESTSLAVGDAGRGTEAAARDARYRWFDERLDDNAVLLLAHHLDDQAETLLLRLLRGAGPDGLAAMPRRRALAAGELRRPFLDQPRAALESYAQVHDLTWVEDPGNASLAFDRNYLRHEVMPLLEARWPGYRKTFSRAAAQLRELAAARSVVALAEHSSAVGDPGFRVADVPDDTQAAALAIRGWLRERGLPMPPAERLGEFLRQLEQGEGASLATSVYHLTRYRDAVYCHAGAVAAAPQLRNPGIDETLTIPGIGVVRIFCEYPEYLADVLVLRTRREGDRLAAADGSHRSLKTLFQGAGIPPWWRSRVPVLAYESEQELLAVGPFARSPLARQAGIGLHWEPDSGLPARH